MAAKDCGPLFPGVPYQPMKREDLNRFVLDVQRLGFTQWRKVRLLSAVGRFCMGVAFQYATSYKIDVRLFSGPSWQAINNAISNYEYDNKGGFCTLLAFWLRAEFQKFLFADNMTPKRYHGDKYARKTVSIFSPVQIGKNDSVAQIIDLLPGEDGNETIRQIFNGEDVEKILNAGGLSDKQKAVLKQSFGIGCGGVGLDFRTLGNIHGLSAERIRQIKSKAIKKLQSNLIKNKIT